MVATVGSISIDLSTNTAKFIAGFQKSATTVERESKRMAASVRGIESSFRLVASSAAAFIGGATVRQISRYADAWTTAGNKIRAASEMSEMQGRSIEALNVIADRSRSGIEATVDLYTKLLRSSAGVAKSEKEVAEATEIVAKSFKAGGAAANEQAAGILQLGQALSSGLLQGDELRSIRENAPVLAQAIADEFGTTIGKLKELGAAGELTSARVFKAIIKGRKDVEAAFAQTKPTIEDAFTRFQNSLIKSIAKLDSTTGASRKLIAEIDRLGGAIERFVTAPSFEKFLELGEIKIEKGGLMDRLLQGFKEEILPELSSGEIKLIDKKTSTFITAQIEGARRKLMEFELEVNRTNNLELDLDTKVTIENLKDATAALTNFQTEFDKQFAINERRSALASKFRASENASMADMPGPPPTVHYGADVKSAVEKGTDATKYVAARAADVYRGVGQLDTHTAGYFDELGSSLAGGFRDIGTALRSIPWNMRTQAAANEGFKFSGLGSSSSWAGRRFTVGGVGPSMTGPYGRPLAMDSGATTDASSITGGTTSGAINVNIVVKPVMEGTRLSGQSTAEIKQAASAGANAALRAYYGR
jgi:tape measure domain-containing protein